MDSNDTVEIFLNIAKGPDESLSYRRFEEKIRELIKEGWTASDLLEHLERARPRDESSAEEIILSMMDRVSGFAPAHKLFFNE